MTGEKFLEIGDTVITNYMGQDFPGTVILPLKEDLSGGQWATVHVHIAGFANTVAEKNLIVFPSKKEAEASEYEQHERAYPKHPPMRELLFQLKDVFGDAAGAFGGAAYEVEKMLGEHDDN